MSTAISYGSQSSFIYQEENTVSETDNKILVQHNECYNNVYSDPRALNSAHNYLNDALNEPNKANQTFSGEFGNASENIIISDWILVSSGENDQKPILIPVTYKNFSQKGSLEYILSNALVSFGNAGQVLLNNLLKAASQGKALAERTFHLTIDTAKCHGPAIQDTLYNSLMSAYTATKSNAPGMKVSFIRAIEHGQKITFAAKEVAIENLPTLQRVLGNAYETAQPLFKHAARTGFEMAAEHGPNIFERACSVASSACQAIPKLINGTYAHYQNTSDNDELIDQVIDISDADNHEAIKAKETLAKRLFAGVRNGAASVASATYSVFKGIYNASIYVLKLPVRAVALVIEGISYIPKALFGLVSNTAGRIYNAF